MANTILGLFRKAGGDDPLADLNSLASWTAKQPASDFLGIQEAMVRVLEGLATQRPRVTPNRVRAVLEFDRLSMPIQARLLKQFLQPLLSDAIRQRLWHARDDLARWFAYTYETQFDGLQEYFLSRKARGLLPGVTARLFYYRGQQAKNTLFRYERWIPVKWKGLHAGYEAARKRGLEHVQVAFAPDSPAYEHCSPEQEYLQILLMQRINTGNLGALQIEMAASWLRGWAHTLVLTDPPLEGAGFWLDLGLGDGLLAMKPQSAQGALLYLDIAPLQKEIGNGMVELSVQMRRVGAALAQGEAAERLALLQRLEQLWGPNAKQTARRGARVSTDRSVNVAAGLVDIAAALQGWHSGDGELNRQYRRSEPAEVADGLPQAISGPAGTGVTDNARGTVSSWRMRDTSESGCKLVSQLRQGAEQKLGNLIGIQEVGDSRWKIGIVRRLKKTSGDQIEIGVEILAQNSLLIAPKPVDSRDTGYSVNGIDIGVEGKGFDALYLPPMQSAGRAPRRSMVVPAPEYAERRRFLMTFDNSAYTIEFTKTLERNRDWVWSGFDIVAQVQ